MYLSRNFPAAPSPFQVVAGTMMQAAYIEAYPDLAGSRQNVSKKVQNVHQVGSQWVDPRGADVQQVDNRLTTG